MMKVLPDDMITLIAEKFATDFINQLQLDTQAEQRCEWSCILWSKDHWAAQAQKAKIDLHQTKERLSSPPDSSKSFDTLFTNSQFLNTVAQVHSKLFDGTETSCTVKDFPNCPYMGQRQGLLNKGKLASVFVTILHKATLYSMLDEHPLDSGLLDEEYRNVYGIDLTNYQDLENSLRDGRFANLFEATVKRARQLAGLPQKPAF
jgi:hypothetical protein